MSTVVDHLVTKYTLDDSAYKRGASSVMGATGNMGNSLKGLAASFTAVAAAAGALAYGGFSAMKAAAQFDTMASTFAGAFGSMEAGTQVMKALEDRATRSAYSLEALTQASVRLATSGLSLNRFVPMMEKFALVVSGTDPQGLEQVASAFARIKGGSFGEAMEVFRRAGIGADTLRAQGIKVDKGGQIQSSADEVFAALERIVGPGSQIDNIAQSVAQSAGVTISNAGDAIGQAIRSIGTELNEQFLPMFKSATEGLATFTKAGGFTLAIESAFGGLAVSAGELDLVLAEFVGNLLGWKEYLDRFFNFEPGETMEMKQNAAEGVRAEFMARYMFNRRKAAREKEAMLPGESGTVATQPPASSTGYNTAAIQAQYLAQIANNTKRMVTLQEMVVGGGGLAAMGIAANDLSLYRQGRNRPASTDPMLRQLGIYVQTQTLATMGGVR